MLDELYAVTFVLPTNDDKLKKEAMGRGGGGGVMKSELAQVCFTAGLDEQCIQDLSFYICGVTQKLTTGDGEGTNELSNHN